MNFDFEIFNLISFLGRSQFSSTKFRVDLASKNVNIDAFLIGNLCIKCRIIGSIFSDIKSQFRSFFFRIESEIERFGFLSAFQVRPKFLECLVVGCLYLASKCKEEDEKISITPEFVIDCDSKCSSNELLRMEKLILDKFNWFIDFVTPMDFLQIVTKRYFHLDVNYFLVFLLSSKYFSLIVKKMSKPDENFLLSRFIELEIQMASCLQHDHLSIYKPRILSLALISLEFERQQSEWNIDWLSSIISLQHFVKVKKTKIEENLCSLVRLVFRSITMISLNVEI